MQYWDDTALSSAPDGMYLCYVDHDHLPNVADKILLMLINGSFSYRGSDVNYRGHIYGAYGPVPAMRLTK